jgi:hypothetical protein
MVACRQAPVLIGYSIVDHLELAEQPNFKIRRSAAGADIVYEECLQPVIPKADDPSPH